MKDLFDDNLMGFGVKDDTEESRVIGELAKCFLAPFFGADFEMSATTNLPKSKVKRLAGERMLVITSEDDNTYYFDVDISIIPDEDEDGAYIPLGRIVKTYRYNFQNLDWTGQ